MTGAEEEEISNLKKKKQTIIRGRVKLSFNYEYVGGELRGKYPHHKIDLT